MFGCPPRLEVRRPSPTTVEFIVTTQPRRCGWAGWAVAAAVMGVRLALALAAGLVLWVWGGSAVGGRAAQTDAWWEALAVWAAASPEGAGDEDGGVLRRLLRRHMWPVVGPVVGPLVSHYVPLVRAAPAHVVLPLCAAAAWASVARVHTSESLLVLRGLGIQTRSTGSTYLGELLAGVSLVWWAATTGLWSLVVASMRASVTSYSSSFSSSSSSASALSPSRASALFLLREPLPAATRFIPTEKLQDLLVNEAFRGFEVRYYLVAVVNGGTGGGGSGEGRRRQKKQEQESTAPATASGGIDEFKGDCDPDNQDDEQDYNDIDVDEEDGYADNDSDSSSEEDEDHIVVVFPRLLPGLDIVRTVWREARACLYEPDAKG